MRATVSLDGHVTKITRPTNSTTVFGNVLFDSGTISNTSHTLILTNAGSTTDSPLQLDKLHLQGSPILDVEPVTITTSAASTSTVASIHTTNSTVLQSSLVSQTSLSGSASVSQTSFPSVITDSNVEVVSLPQEFKATVTGNNGALYWTHSVLIANSNQI